jgi:hypothetical protein
VEDVCAYLQHASATITPEALNEGEIWGLIKIDLVVDQFGVHINEA